MIAQNIIISIFYNHFLYRSVPQRSVVVPAFINKHYFIFQFKGGKHLSTVLFSAEKSHSLPDLFLGAEQQVVLIYGDFITREECFQNACYLQPPPGHACMQLVFCRPNERLLAHVFNKAQSESAEERGREH